MFSMRDWSTIWRKWVCVMQRSVSKLQRWYRLTFCFAVLIPAAPAITGRKRGYGCHGNILSATGPPASLLRPSIIHPSDLCVIKTHSRRRRRFTHTHFKKVLWGSLNWTWWRVFKWKWLLWRSQSEKKKNIKCFSHTASIYSGKDKEDSVCMLW